MRRMHVLGLVLLATGQVGIIARDAGTPARHQLARVHAACLAGLEEAADRRQRLVGDRPERYASRRAERRPAWGAWVGTPGPAPRHCSIDCSAGVAADLNDDRLERQPIEHFRAGPRPSRGASTRHRSRNKPPSRTWPCCKPRPVQNGAPAGLTRGEKRALLWTAVLARRSRPSAILREFLGICATANCSICRLLVITRLPVSSCVALRRRTRQPAALPDRYATARGKAGRRGISFPAMGKPALHAFSSAVPRPPNPKTSGSTLATMSV